MNRISYGVNVGHYDHGELRYERYLTFQNFTDAKNVFDVLVMGNEQDLWSAVEIQEIHEMESGDFEYYTVLKVMLMVNERAKAQAERRYVDEER